MEWSDWDDSSVLIVINTDKDKVNIYSSTTQHYDIYDYQDVKTDSDGGETMTFKCVDDDGLRCEMRFKVINGRSQIYVDYDDAMWVYSVVQK